jgi:hypothetical protein
VVERCLEGGVPGEDGHPEAGERAQPLAEVKVEGLHPLLAALAEPVAIGRVGDQEPVVEVRLG